MRGAGRGRLIFVSGIRYRIIMSLGINILQIIVSNKPVYFRPFENHSNYHNPDLYSLPNRYKKVMTHVFTTIIIWSLFCVSFSAVCCNYSKILSCFKLCFVYHYKTIGICSGFVSKTYFNTNMFVLAIIK